MEHIIWLPQSSKASLSCQSILPHMTSHTIDWLFMSQNLQCGIFNNVFDSNENRTQPNI